MACYCNVYTASCMALGHHGESGRIIVPTPCGFATLFLSTWIGTGTSWIGHVQPVFIIPTGSMGSMVYRSLHLP